MTADATPTSPPGRRRALVQPVAVGLLVVVAFVGTYLLLLLAPTPHGLRLAVADRPGAVAVLDDALRAALPGPAVVPVAVADATAAESAVRDRTAAGAYLPGEHTLLVARAGGPATAQALVGALTAATGRPLAVRDLAPLPSTDPRGLAGFYLVFGTVLAGFVFGQTSHLSGRVLPLRLRLAQTAVLAPVAGTLAALIAGPLTGATPAPVALVAVVLALLVGAVALTTQAATAALGDPGVLVATLGLLTLGNAAGGGAIPVAFLPAGLRQVAELLPPGAAVRALQNAAFPDAVDIARPYLVLLAWSAAGLAVLLASYARLPATAPLLSRSLAPVPTP